MKIDIDFNSDFDKDFENAFHLSEKHFSHEELISLLKGGSIREKQIAALKLDYVENEDDVKAILNNLTGCDGKIREAVGYKINKLLSEDIEVRKLFAPLCAETFADATIDINANICRLAVDSAVLLKNNTDFGKEYSKKIVKYALEALDELEKFIFRDKKYVINKQIFKLYWCLEGINYFWDFIDNNVLEEILTKSSNRDEYTIREKTAQAVISSNKFPNLRKKLINDENYYVRNLFN